MNSPYLSFVIAGRNDDYGGDFNERLQNSVHFLAKSIEQYRIPIEFLIVNYNPLSGKPSIYDAIDWPKNRQYLTFRIITVPPELHQQLEQEGVRKSVPLFEYIAKNIGIRRASGRFICAANPDIIFDPAIIRCLRKQRLLHKAYYRVDRCDFKNTDLNGVHNLSGLKVIRHNVYRIFLKGNKYEVKSGSHLGWQLFKRRLYNYFRLKYDIHLLKIDKFAQEKLNLTVDYHNAEFFCHCNVSGDFMLMHRDNWFKLNGYPEKTRLSLHTDALMVVMAFTSGLKEQVLKWPIYHQEHQRRYDADKSGEDQSLRDAYLQFQDDAQRMLKDKKPIIYNNEDWGLRDFQFDELIF